SVVARRSVRLIIAWQLLVIRLWHTDRCGIGAVGNGPDVIDPTPAEPSRRRTSLYRGLFLPRASRTAVRSYVPVTLISEMFDWKPPPPPVYLASLVTQTSR